MKVSTILSITSLGSSVYAGLPHSLEATIRLLDRQSTWTVGQEVDTSSGKVTGQAAKNASDVSEYLGIRFAQAPIGDLRFAAPVKFNGTEAIDGTSFGASCPIEDTAPRKLPSAAVLDAANITAAGLAVLGVLSNGGATYSEDCLFVNVWTKPQTGDAKKAVLVWMYGGGFTGGSSTIGAYNGANIVEEQDVIVVSLNYRLNVLGFPGNPNSTQNLALLDQRLAVEWVRDNIEKFGGDTSRITLFGQSAGGASVDLYSYAWKEDPIAAGFIPESGNALGWDLPSSRNRSATYWFNVTETLGCGDAKSNPDEVLTCMRKQNYTDILSAVPELGSTAGILGGFGPTVDDTVVFANYSTITPANVPMLIGNTNYEAGLFRLQFALGGQLLRDNFWNGFNLVGFTCPAAKRSKASIDAKIPTWRYRYFGVFPNLAFSRDAGAYHTSEVPMIFNTAPGDATTEQISIGKYMRGAWAAFAKNPKTGLDDYGWPQYNESTDSLVRLAYNNITGPNLINPSRYDADCILLGGISSTADPASAPQLPDLGADVTPTGANGGNPPRPTASSTSTTSSTPTSSQSPAVETANSGMRNSLGLGVWVGIAFAFAGLL